MTKAQLKALTQEDIIAKYDDYRAGKLDSSDYILFLKDVLENYFISMINKLHRTMSSDFEDQMQQCYLALCEHYDQYDPHLSTPTSFFTKYIVQYTKQALDNGGMSPYYVSLATQLDKAAKQYGYTGINDENLDAQTLATISNTPLESVVNTLEQQRITLNSLSETTENIVAKNKFVNPEQAVLDEELKNFCEAQLARLTPLEHFLVYYQDMADPSEKKSYRTLLITIKQSPELMEKFKADLKTPGFDQRTLEAIHNRAINKMSNNVQTKRYMDNRNNDITFEQASDDDIAGAVNLGLLLT